MSRATFEDDVGLLAFVAFVIVLGAAVALSWTFRVPGILLRMVWCGIAALWRSGRCW